MSTQLPEPDKWEGGSSPYDGEDAPDTQDTEASDEDR